MQRKLMKIIVIGSVFFVLILAGCQIIPGGQKPVQGDYVTGQAELPSRLIKINGLVISIEIADDVGERQGGLSRRGLLEQGAGMLFVFDTVGFHSIWMKEMNFPIDIIWFDESREVVDVVTAAEPGGTLPTKTYRPKKQALYVLEVPVGFVSDYSILPGDKFEFCLDVNCEVASIVAVLDSPDEEPKKEIDWPEKIVDDPEDVPEDEPIVIELPSHVVYEVPFTAQAPFGKWSDPRQQDGCEEAAILMAVRWLKEQDMTKDEALEEILALSEYQGKEYGYYHDTSASDTAQLFRDFYQVENISVSTDISLENIKRALANESLVITPMDGRGLGNPYYSNEGPSRHMILIIGYDDETQEFITNDPGTRHGESYRYAYDVFIDAIRDYPSGHDVVMKEERQAMIVVGR